MVNEKNRFLQGNSEKERIKAERVNQPAQPPVGGDKG